MNRSITRRDQSWPSGCGNFSLRERSIYRCLHEVIDFAAIDAEWIMPLAAAVLCSAKFGVKFRRFLNEELSR